MSDVVRISPPRLREDDERGLHLLRWSARPRSLQKVAPPVRERPARRHSSLDGRPLPKDRAHRRRLQGRGRSLRAARTLIAAGFTKISTSAPASTPRAAPSARSRARVVPRRHPAGELARRRRDSRRRGGGGSVDELVLAPGEEAEEGDMRVTPTMMPARRAVFAFMPPVGMSSSCRSPPGSPA